MCYKIQICFILFMFLFNKFTICQESDLNKFLTKRASFVNNQLKSLNNESNKEIQYNLQIDSENATLLKTCMNLKLFSLFNNSYVILCSEVYLIFSDGEKFVLNSPSNFPQFEENISFVKTYKYNKIHFLLVTFLSGFSSLYGFKNNTNENFFIQSIHHENTAIDAFFFENQNNLYIVTTEGKNFYGQLRIYKWIETHFDEIKKLATKDSKQISTFSSSNSEIIIVLQNLNNADQTTLITYEFNNDELIAKQQLNSQNVKHIFNFVIENKEYLAVFEKNGNVIIYLWNGNEFTDLAYFNNNPHTDEIIFLVYINKIPIIFAAKKDTLSAYNLTPNDIQLFSKIQLTQHFQKILNIQHMRYKELDYIFIAGIEHNNKTVIEIIQFSTKIKEKESQDKESNAVLRCMMKLEQTLIADQLFRKTSPKVIREVTEEKINLTTPAFSNLSKAKQNVARQEKDKLTKIKEKMNFLRNKIKEYNKQFNNNQMTIKGEIVMKKGIHASTLTARNVQINHLNGKKWNPSDWLSYTKLQTINHPAFINNLIVNELLTPSNDLFKDVLLLNGNQIIEGSHNFNTITATKIFTTTLNNIPFNNIYLNSSPLQINGIKQFNNINIDKLQVNNCNERNVSDVMHLFANTRINNYIFKKKILIKNFDFEELNGVHWNTFHDSVFRIGTTTTITGTLTIPEFNTDKLNTKTLSKIATKNILTTSTEQIINSNITFDSINTKNINTNTINFIKIEDIATYDEGNNHIEGPVRMNNLHVTNNFYIHGINNASHIVGTNESDLLQIYNKKVKIIGNLELKNLQFLNTTNLIINGKKFRIDYIENYWLKNKNQDIPVHFEAINGLSMPHLFVQTVNNVHVSNYMQNNLEDKLPTKFHFQNVTILGNVFIDETLNHTPNFKKIQNESILQTGIYKIKGEKYFQNRIKIGKLKTNYLDNKNVSKAITKTTKMKIEGTKYFEILIVKNNMMAKSIKTDFINDVNLEYLRNNSFYIDVPFAMENVNFEQLIVGKLHTSKLNNEIFANYLHIFNQFDDITTLNNVTINEDMRIDSVQNLFTLNGINIKILLKQMVNKNENTTIRGDVTFLGNVITDHLKITMVNDLNLAILAKRLLYKDFVQNINARYTFNVIKSPKINLTHINDINLNGIINVKDKKTQILKTKATLTFNQLKIINSIKAETLNCDLDIIFKNLIHPIHQNWYKIHVLKNVTLMDNDSTLKNILDNAVTKYINSTIYAPVTFENHIVVDNIFSLHNINDVNITELYKDALMKYSSKPQVIINGKKTFDTLTMKDALVIKNADIPVINEISIIKLNESIIYKENINKIIIKGHKTFFSGLQTNKLQSSFISGIYPDNLVNLDNLKSIPKAIFHNISIKNDFNIQYINNISFTEIIEKRIKLNCIENQDVFGIYYFEDVSLNNNCTTTHINNINLDDVVTDEGIQNIYGSKHFIQNLEINGKAYMNQINDMNVTETLKNTILLNEDNTIDSNVVFTKETIVKGDVQTNMLNGLPIKQLKYMIESEIPKMKITAVQDLINKIGNQVVTCLNIIERMPNKFMYLEKTNELQISLPKTIDAQAIQTKEHVMIHVETEENGLHCGLPEKCRCPLQYTLEITPQLSVNTFLNKGFQRIFSYDDESITMHFITNSISTDYECRITSEKIINEISSLTWNTVTTKDKLGEFYLYPEHPVGYISTVKYFTTKNHTYVVVGRFYNPITDTHNMDCLVIKLSEKKDTAELIQTIPTNGVRVLYTFHTAQNVILIICNQFDVDNSVQIYRFNGNKFKFLRSIPGVNCTSVASVVLNEDSLIVLAQKTQTLQVLKYVPNYDNYYFYQGLHLDSSVLGVSAFYTGGFGISEAYLSIVTESNNFYIYNFHHIEGWKLQFNSEINGLKTLVPFSLQQKPYLFAPSSNLSSLLTFIKQGPH